MLYAIEDGDIYISIHAPREGGDSELGGGDCHMGISIHAPREGGDAGSSSSDCDRWISIHAPREGGDAACSTAAPSSAGFQSTPPARGATGHVGVVGLEDDDFNPRPPRGGRRYNCGIGA